METPEIIRFVGSFLIVLALMGGLALVLRKLGAMQGVPSKIGGNKRMKVIESLSLDYRRRLFLVQCDDRQHVIMLGPNGETMIDTAPASSALNEDTQGSSHDKAV